MSLFRIRRQEELFQPGTVWKRAGGSQRPLDLGRPVLLEGKAEIEIRNAAGNLSYRGNGAIVVVQGLDSWIRARRGDTSTLHRQDDAIFVTIQTLRFSEVRISTGSIRGVGRTQSGVVLVRYFDVDSHDELQLAVRGEVAEGLGQLCERAAAINEVFWAALAKALEKDQHEHEDTSEPDEAT